MASPTLTEIYSQTRAACGDTEVSGGQIYTDTLLLPHVQAATRRLWSALRNLATPRVRRTLYYTLPANTSVFFPSSAAVNDFSEPSGRVGVRGGVTLVAISTVTQSGQNLLVTTSAPHGLSTGAVVILERMTGMSGANIQATITVTGASTFTANGVVASGTYTTGGYAVTSSNDFAEIGYFDTLAAATNQSNTQVFGCVYREGRFQFTPASEAYQLRIFYWSSAEVPVAGGDVVAFNDSIDFLAKYAASEACRAQGAIDRYAMLRSEAVGDAYTNGIIGGDLRQLMQSAVRQMQNQSPYQRGPRSFREQHDDYGVYV